MKIKIKEHNINKWKNDTPYIEYDEKDDSLDYCLGKTLKEGGDICRQIVSYRKKSKKK